MDGGGAHSRRELHAGPGAIGSRRSDWRGRCGKNDSAWPGRETDSRASHAGGRNAAASGGCRRILSRAARGVQIRAGGRAQALGRTAEGISRSVGGAVFQSPVNDDIRGAPLPVADDRGERAARPADLRVIEGEVAGLRRGSAPARLTPSVTWVTNPVTQESDRVRNPLNLWTLSIGMGLASSLSFPPVCCILAPRFSFPRSRRLFFV